MDLIKYFVIKKQRMPPKRTARKIGTRVVKTGITEAVKNKMKQAVKREMNAKLDAAVNAAVRRGL